MSKQRFTQQEVEVWKFIHTKHAPHRPTTNIQEILVRDFLAQGLVPVVLRVEDRFFPWNEEKWREGLVHVRNHVPSQADSYMQVFYHPKDCEEILGASQSVYPHWGRQILVHLGYLGPDATDSDPVLREHVLCFKYDIHIVNYLRLRGLLKDRVVPPRLVAVGALAFFIAAHTACWISADTMARPNVFKRVIRRAVRDCPVLFVDFPNPGLEDLLTDIPLPVPSDKPEKVVSLPSVEEILGEVTVEEMLDRASEDPLVVVSTTDRMCQACVDGPGDDCAECIGTPQTSPMPEASFEHTRVYDLLENPDRDEDDATQLRRLEDEIKRMTARKEALLKTMAEKAEQERQARMARYLEAKITDVTFNESGKPVSMLLSLKEGMLCMLEIGKVTELF